VREAIALMFNFEWTNQTLFYGLYSPIDSFWENTHLEAEGLPPPAELACWNRSATSLPEEVFTEALRHAAIGPRPHLRPPPGAPRHGAAGRGRVGARR
jgi:ABC-type oligopeptide transport system substrate-binding subunit